MSETADFYSSWLGTNLFGVTSSSGVEVTPLVVFEPTDLSNCAIWFDATDNLTVTDISGVVQTWVNKGLSGGSANLNDGQVLTNQHIINGQNVLHFQPYADLLFNFTQTVDPCTVFVVTRPITDLSGAPLPYINWFDALSTIYNVGFSMFYDTSANQWAYGIGANNLAIYVAGYDPTNPTNQTICCTIRNDTNISNNLLQLNSTPIPLSFDAPASYNLSNFNYYMGSSVHGTEFDYAEMIFYERALSDAEVAQVNAYLSAKWSI